MFYKKFLDLLDILYFSKIRENSPLLQRDELHSYLFGQIARVAFNSHSPRAFLDLIHSQRENGLSDSFLEMMTNMPLECFTSPKGLALRQSLLHRVVEKRKRAQLIRPLGRSHFVESESDVL